MHCRAFTLIELLVVVSIIALLIAILMPVIGSARQAAQRTACLSNIKQLEIAHWAYMTDRNGQMLGTSHSDSWINVLREQYNPMLLMRSPLDTSPHFEGGTAIGGQYRQTSYSLNLYLSEDGVNHGLPEATGKLDKVPQPGSVIHSSIAVFAGSNAVLDHFHPQSWQDPNPLLPPVFAAGELQTNAHQGELGAGAAVSAYGFLDGHAEALPFSETYESADQNHYNPAAAQ